MTTAEEGGDPKSPYADLTIDHESKPYWDGCRERRLLITRCDACGFWIHFPRLTCPRCWSSNVTPTEVSGDGHVYTFAVYHEGPDRVAAVVVELVEQVGLHFPCMLAVCPVDEIEIGMAVELTWLDHKGLPAPAFRPRTSVDGVI